MRIRKGGFRGKGRMGNQMMGTPHDSPGPLAGRVMNAAPANPSGPLSPAPKLPGTGRSVLRGPLNLPKPTLR